MNVLNNLEELDIYKTIGLIEIAKHNQLFHGYWDFDRKEFYKNFDNLLKHNIKIVIPDLSFKYIKSKYIECFDYM